MRQRTVAAAILITLALVAAGTWAEEDIIDNALTACENEIKSYCSQVTPGEGRLLACFYAHGDKLSGGCEYALYTAADELEQFVAAVAHLARECKNDLMEHCAEVEIGEGRVASCLLEHKEKVTAACRQAIDAAELEVVEE